MTLMSIGHWMLLVVACVMVSAGEYVLALGPLVGYLAILIVKGR